jgi:hypothetical protein
MGPSRETAPQDVITRERSAFDFIDCAPRLVRKSPNHEGTPDQAHPFARPALALGLAHARLRRSSSSAR